MTQHQTLTKPSENFTKVSEFLRTLSIADLPPVISETASLYILDLIGVLIASQKLEAGSIAKEYSVKHWAAGEGASAARLPLDGRKVSLPGAAFTIATQIDSLDAHDGWQTAKGHAGAGIFPALVVFSEAKENLSGPEALALMIAGYEISYWAALALHSTVPDYHTSGAWNALGCVAMGARLFDFDDVTFRHALGIAEYHGPRSQMMREIANPTMLHDGSGFGAPVGVYATLIAQDGFTGAPAATIEFDDAVPHWSELGTRWLTCEQYIKPYPICRWAHAPLDAAFNLQKEHGFDWREIETVEVESFAEAVALNSEVPDTSPKAQYSLAWPLAAALVRGKVTADEIHESSFSDPALKAMCARITARETDFYNETFPDGRFASVKITMKSGQVFESGPTAATGGPDPQPTQGQVVNKFRTFAGSVLPEDRVSQIEEAALSLTDANSDFKKLVDLLIAKP